MNSHRLLAVLLMAVTIAACGKDDSPKVNNSNPNDTGIGDAGGGDSGGNGDSGGGDATTSDMGRDAAVGGDMNATATVVQTTLGPVAGADSNGIRSFKGIPYAAPPIGRLRFRPPAAAAAWTDPLDATQFGASCPQRDKDGVTFGNEDCLSLNVWSRDGAQNLPVIFFIHGGGFVAGESSNPLYDGSNLAAQDVVVVTINYRLGALGFLAIDELAAENADDTAGNYGFLDQQFAMQWVQDNIAAFGGDPTNVTIFGESAGGVSVCGHLGAPSSEGLFSRAIVESGGGCTGYARLRTGTLVHDPAVMTGAQFVAAAACDQAADVAQCLRDLPFERTVEAEWALAQTSLGLPPFGLNVDGVVLPDDPAQRFRDGTARDVPILIGSNADEATLFTLTTPVPTVAVYEAYVNATFGALGPQVLAVYPASDFPKPKDAYNTLFSDVGFICPALRFAGVSGGGAEPTHTYHVTRVIPGATSALGAFHGLELFYVFGTFDSVANYTPSADDFALRDAMMGEWTSFATDGSLSWNGYDRLAPEIRVFDTTVETVSEIREGRCTDLFALGIVP